MIYIDDLVKLVDQTSTGVSHSIDESLRKNGYDNIGDFVQKVSIVFLVAVKVKSLILHIVLLILIHVIHI